MTSAKSFRTHEDKALATGASEVAASPVRLAASLTDCVSV